jgi:hypothetical protein
LLKKIPKALSIRFDPVLNKMILPCQIAFIKTRDITDGIVYLHEILYECKRRKWQGVILKLDFEKHTIK